RKRIALSIKQTQQVPERTAHKDSRQKTGNQNSPKKASAPKEKDNSSMEDAMSLLRKKFGK
ncbi:MAG TPA: hypothetical protein VLS85_14670, partial [Hanamia sp.]|nr:hypothetical protein [Hanamia sp.]